MTKDKSLQVDFSGLILGFSSAALCYMGHANVEGKVPPQENYSLALQNIDIIELLHEKTAGNLALEEKKLIEEVLLDLKSKYSKLVR
jgi:hypothetical protein